MSFPILLTCSLAEPLCRKSYYLQASSLKIDFERPGYTFIEETQENQNLTLYLI